MSEFMNWLENRDPELYSEMYHANRHNRAVDSRTDAQEARDAMHLQSSIKRALNLVPQALKIKPPFDYGGVKEALKTIKSLYSQNDFVAHNAQFENARNLIVDYIIKPLIEAPKGPANMDNQSFTMNIQNTLQQLSRDVEMALEDRQKRFGMAHGQQNLPNYDKRIKMSTRPLEDDNYRGVV